MKVLKDLKKNKDEIKQLEEEIEKLELRKKKITPSRLRLKKWVEDDRNIRARIEIENYTDKTILVLGQANGRLIEDRFKCSVEDALILADFICEYLAEEVEQG